MLRKSLQLQALPMTLMPWDRKKCRLISYFVIAQCVIVYIGSFTILHCIWSLDFSLGMSDYNKLVRIMYLYDHEACGYKLHKSVTLSNIELLNNTHGLKVLPIRWKQAQITVSTRLSSKTRVYIESSLAVHILWMLLAIVLNLMTRTMKYPRLLKINLFAFFCCSVCVVTFDISMAFVYIAHIQKSVTKGMILRYSGWSVEIQLESYDDFAGWIPIVASVCWMRGIGILVWNMYCCKLIYAIHKRIKKREVKTRLFNDGYTPIPDPKDNQLNDRTVLYYRRGEHAPSQKEEDLSRIFFN